MGALSVLVIANDPSVRRDVSRAFQEVGCLVLEAGDWGSISDETRSLSPNLIVIGVAAGASTEDLASGLRFRRVREKVPVFLVTDHGSEELAVRALRCGFADYLKLPLAAGDLLEAIGRWFSAPAEACSPGGQASEEQLID